MSTEGKERLFSEEEVASILRRSARLQTAVDTSAAPGLTLAELQHIAAEVGIDPIHVETASQELDRGIRDDGESARSLFLPLTNHESHILRGEIADDQWQDVLGEIRTYYGEFGASGRVGNELTWVRGKFPEPEVQVAVASRRGRTRVTAHSDYSNLLAFFFPGMFASSAVVAAVTIEGLGLSTGAVVLVFGLWLTVYYLFARAILGRLSRKEKRRARRLADRIGAALDEGLRSEPEGEWNDSRLMEAEMQAEPGASRERRRESL